MIKRTPDYEVCSSTEVKASIPEKCLFAAVLWRAKWDLLPNVNRVDMRSAVRWFDEVFSKKNKDTKISENSITFSQTIEVLELTSKDLAYLKLHVDEAKNYLQRSIHESEQERKAYRKRACALSERPRFRFGTTH